MAGAVSGLQGGCQDATSFAARRVSGQGVLARPFQPRTARAGSVGSNLDARPGAAAAWQVLVAQKVSAGIYKGVTTSELDELAAETAASMTSHHPDYASARARRGA